MKFFFLCVVAIIVTLGVACSSSDDESEPAAAAAPIASPTPRTTAELMPTETGSRVTGAIDSLVAASVDVTQLPIGDAVSTEPEIDAVWLCQTNFGGPGAIASGTWINDDGTFDLTTKPTVDGEVEWPSEFAISLNEDVRTLTGNALPDHLTGEYPIASNDDAYQYDRNPNSISAQTLQIDLPANPVVADEPSCLSLGPIGVMLTGSGLQCAGCPGARRCGL